MDKPDIAALAERVSTWRMLAGLWLYGLVAGERGRRAMLLMADAAIRDRSRNPGDTA